jgi:hypothetical protein
MKALKIITYAVLFILWAAILIYLSPNKWWYGLICFPLSFGFSYFTFWNFDDKHQPNTIL